MSADEEQTPELPFLFGAGFLQDHAGHIITDARIALIELIANSYDAGASSVEISWPSDLGQPFLIKDNGTGMTKAEFEKRWKTLCYNRLQEQGTFVQSPNKVASKRRVAFGRSGKGRHGAFCFADVYHVETWRDGTFLEVRVERTDGGQTPFLCVVEREGDRTGHGTQIRADVQKNLLRDTEVRELIGSKFAVDPTFEILVNREAIKLLQLKGLVTTEIPVNDIGNIIVHRIDSEIQDRTSQLRGITWWVNKRTVGNSSWEGLDGEGAYLDGRTSIAKRYSFVVEADILKKQVKDDWTGFRASSAFHSVRDAVHKHVVAALNEIQASSRKERKKAALAQTRTALKELTPLSQNAVVMFVEQVQEKCPTLSERDLFRTVEIYTKLESARSGYDLLKQLNECSSEDLDAWNQIMQRWTAGNAEIVLSELEHRLKLIERLQSLVDSSKTDELHDLQPLFERGLWMFGPEYDAVDFHSNRYLATIIRESLGGAGRQVANRRPDFVAFPDRSIGIYSAASFEEQGEISGIRRILVVELKKGGFQLSQKELDQALDYSRELYKATDIRPDTKTISYVLGSTGEGGLEEAKYGDRITIVPMLYRTLLDRAHARTFNLQRKIEQLGLGKPKDEQLEEVLSSAEQPELEPLQA